MTSKKKQIEKIFLPNIINEKNLLINKILEYSAIKIKANPPLLYSVLNPDTNSDSPSAKSNGERFVSARKITIKIIKKEIFKKKKLKLN